MKKLIAALLLLAAVAIGQTVTDQYKVDLGPKDHKADHVFEQRVYVNGVATFDGGVSFGIGSAPILFTAKATRTWDFPALSSSGETSLTPCAETASTTATGAAIGDQCVISSDLGTDGGAALLSTAFLSCRATTGAVIGKLCVLLTDGGTYNLGDAGFFMRTFR